jgi:hypothetical protein
MTQVIYIVISVAVLAVFVWLLRGSGGSEDAVIDPNDSRTIGNLIGLTGGTIADAAVARFALQRFEEVHGRKATVRDMAIVAGMMKSNRG